MSVSWSALKIGIIFDILNFSGVGPKRDRCIENVWKKTGDMTLLEYLRGWVGQEFYPSDLLFGMGKIWILTSDGVTGFKKNECSDELDFLRYSVKGLSAGGNLIAKLLPPFEKCLFKILGIREESVIRLLW